MYEFTISQIIGYGIGIAVVSLILCALVRLWLSSKKTRDKKNSEKEALLRVLGQVVLGKKATRYGSDDPSLGLSHRLEHIEKELGIKPPKRNSEYW